MTKSNAKKAARHKRKLQDRTRKQQNRRNVHHAPTVVNPSSSAEWLGETTALAGWIGRKVSSVFRLHR